MDDWQAASVTNCAVVEDLTLRQPDFEPFLHRPGHMHVQVGADKVTKLLSGDPQTMDRIVNSCPLTKFVGSLMILHEAEDDDVNWLNSMQTIHHSRNEYFDLMWICCTTYSCTSAAVDKIPTDRQRVDSRSVYDK